MEVHAPAALPTGRLGVLQSRMDAMEERKNLPLPWIEPRPSSPKPFAIQTELSRFLDNSWCGKKKESCLTTKCAKRCQLSATERETSMQVFVAIQALGSSISCLSSWRVEFLPQIEVQTEFSKEKYFHESSFKVQYSENFQKNKIIIRNNIPVRVQILHTMSHSVETWQNVVQKLHVQSPKNFKILWRARCRSTVNSGNIVYNRC
jgi:hypothetical protein